MHEPHPSTFPVTREGYCTEIAGISVVDIAGRFGTPTFVYDGATIAARVRSLSRFDVVRYAQKACSNIAVLDLCRREGIKSHAFYAWTKDFMEAGKERLGRDATRDATQQEVQQLRRENEELKLLVGELSLDLQRLKKTALPPLRDVNDGA